MPSSLSANVLAIQAEDPFKESDCHLEERCMHMNDVQLLHFKRYLEKECRLLEIGQLLDANRKVLASVEREYLKREEMNALMNKHVRERARPRRRRRRARGSVSFVGRRLTAYPHPPSPPSPSRRKSWPSRSAKRRG